MTPDQLNDLDRLAKVPPLRLVGWLRDVGRFANADLPDTGLPPERRRLLMTDVGAYGVHRACCYLRDGLGEAELGRRLLADSGLDDLRDLVVSHFDRRATVVKLDAILRSVSAHVRRLRVDTRPEVRSACDKIGTAIERFQHDEHSFDELDALGACYRGELQLSAGEMRHLRASAGESGGDAYARLGCPRTASVDALIAEAESLIGRWSARLAASELIDLRTRTAMRTALRSYERVLSSLQEARRLIENDG